MTEPPKSKVVIIFWFIRIHFLLKDIQIYGNINEVHILTNMIALKENQFL